MRKILAIVYMLFITLMLEAVSDPFVMPWSNSEKKKDEKATQVQTSVITDTQKHFKSAEVVSLEMHKESGKQSISEEDVFYPEDFEVSGIIYGDKGGVVIVGDKFLFDGDKIDEHCVIHTIRLDSVLVQCGEYLWEFSVKSEGGEK